MTDEVFGELIDVLAHSDEPPARLAEFADEEAHVRGFESWRDVTG